MENITTEYWNRIWDNISNRKKSLNVNNPIKGYVFYKFDILFKKILKGKIRRGMKLLEIGCGGGDWLVYFAERFGVEVEGVDYSEQGCKLAEKKLKKRKIKAHIIQEDVFKLPSEFLGRYDIIISMGFIEHFENPALVISRIAKYLKEGGIIITEVPNMGGFPGILQKFLNKKVYNFHKVVKKEEIFEMHRNLFLPLFCDYYIPVGTPVNPGGSLVKISILNVIKIFCKMIQMVDLIIPLPSSKFFSPYLIFIGQKANSQNSGKQVC